MSDDKILRVVAEEDFVEKLTVAGPAQALAELIWNGLDAEATEVSVAVDDSQLGLQAIRVRDNGHGIPSQDAEQLFIHLGGSWKRNANKSRNGLRILHGKEGKGRFRALALGRVAEWSVTTRNESKQLVRYKMTVIKDSAKEFRLTPTSIVDGDATTGIEVTISEPFKQWRLDIPSIFQELNEIYMLYLKEYPGVQINFLGRHLDPTGLIEFRRTFILPPIPDVDQTTHPVELEIFEWKPETERSLYLCNEESVPLHKIGPGFGIHAPGFNFSAYLKSTYVSQLNQRGMLELATLDTRLNEAVENAKTELRDHFKARSKEKLKSLVEEWKKEEVYPYKEEPTTPVQKVERQVFDLVAVTAATNLPDFQTQDRRNRKFQLRMLKQAIERGPEQLQMILEEVLELSQQKQEELAKLLKQTTLTSIINASVIVADRLNFLSGLEAMLFDKDLKETFKERSQLHQIVKDNTWVLGEEFALTVSDQSLTKVLVAHAKALKMNVVIDEPIKRPGGRKGIVDLMLSRKIPTNTDEELSHLVVELKAPTVKAGARESEQIKSYAFAVADDERFRGVQTKWSCWLVVNDMDAYVRQETHMKEKPQGLLWESPDPKMISKVWVKTWAQIIHDCRTRLTIFQQALDITATADAGLEYLRKTYARILLGVEPTETAPEPNEGPEPNEQTEVKTETAS
jgi:Histidine kinase-, DNA gyrase B-, and HSP90-like ATPase